MSRAKLHRDVYCVLDPDTHSTTFVARYDARDDASWVLVAHDTRESSYDQKSSCDAYIHDVVASKTRWWFWVLADGGVAQANTTIAFLRGACQAPERGRIHHAERAFTWSGAHHPRARLMQLFCNIDWVVPHDPLRASFFDAMEQHDVAFEDKPLLEHAALAVELAMENNPIKPRVQYATRSATAAAAAGPH